MLCDTVIFILHEYVLFCITNVSMVIKSELEVANLVDSPLEPASAWKYLAMGESSVPRKTSLRRRFGPTLSAQRRCIRLIVLHSVRSGAIYIRHHPAFLRLWCPSCLGLVLKLWIPPLVWSRHHSCYNGFPNDENWLRQARLSGQRLPLCRTTVRSLHPMPLSRRYQYFVMRWLLCSFRRWVVGDVQCEFEFSIGNPKSGCEWEEQFMS